MASVESGSAVQVHYTGKLEDGTVFDTSRDREPLNFTVGEGQVIPGFEKAVMGMEAGDSTTTEVPPQEGYGERREDLVVQVALDRISDEISPEVGQQLQLRLNDGRQVPVIVKSVNEGTVTIDANHPLAGKKLVFDIEVVDVGDNGQEETSDG